MFLSFMKVTLPRLCWTEPQRCSCRHWGRENDAVTAVWMVSSSHLCVFLDDLAPESIWSSRVEFGFWVGNMKFEVILGYFRQV